MHFTTLAASLVLGLSVVAQEPQGDPTSPKAALAAFQDATGGQWISQWHAATATPSAIYGPGLPLADWRANSLDEARRHAARLLVDYQDLLGVGASQFAEEIGARMGRTWTLVYEQSFRGLPVIDGRIDLRIHMTGVVSMLGSRAWPIPADFDVAPAIGDEVAMAIAVDAFVAKFADGGPAAVAPRLCIWGDTNAPQQVPVFLAWEVPVHGSTADAQIGRFYVDAKSGAVLHYHNDRHECGWAGCTPALHARRVAEASAVAAPVADAVSSAPLAAPVVTTVTVMGWTRTGNDALSALVNTPLRNLVFNVPGVGTRTTDANGQFTIDIAAPVTISATSLDGTHHAPVAGPDAPTDSVLVTPGVPATLQLLTAGATTNQAAHTTVAYWIDQVNEWARSILGNTAQLNTADNIAVNVNVTSTCNASYGGNTTNFYNAGGGCSNTAFSTVVAHEWGHGLDDRYGGISNVTGDGLSEGWGDIIGMYLVDSNLLGSGFQSAGVPLRNGVNSRLYPQTGQGVHTAGQVWMGFAWELRTRLRTAFGTPSAIAISNDIVIGSIVADATNQVDAVREVFLADDNDGNLLNGTPHYAQLSGAAIAKSLPYPEEQLATFAHSPLASTTQRLTPRDCLVSVFPITGTVSVVRLAYSTGLGTTLRTMHPSGVVNSYRALLPGVDTGTVTYHFEVTMVGGGTARHPLSGEFSYSVSAAAPFYSENFEAGAVGWSNAQVLVQNDWQLGTPNGRSGVSGGIAWADPTAAASGVNCYANDLGNGSFNGSYGSNVENWLRSPVINCTGRTNVHLRFKRWLSVEDATFDQATLTVNGVVVYQNPVGSHVQDTGWVDVDYAIPGADNNPAVQIEWRLKSDGGVNLGGWAIDDIELTTPGAPLDARLTMLPEQVVGGGAVTLRIETNQPNWPWLLGIASTPGPTTVPGFPTFALGGTLSTGGGVTDGSGVFQTVFLSSPQVSTLGTLLYTQVMTIDPTLTNYVVSNPNVSFWTL